MDCEKFESAMLDELYGELDEVTSAAVKRHMAGCARCSSLLSGLRATRRLASVPLVEPPPGLEQRILDAASSVPASATAGWPLARIVSIAGNWAMRPQTAMAALFLVMIGSSVLLLRGKSSRAPASASITVTEEGTPAPVTSALPTTPEAPPAASGGLPVAVAPAARPEPKAYAANAPPNPAPTSAEIARAKAPAKAVAEDERALQATGNGFGAGGAAVAASPVPAAAPPVAVSPASRRSSPPRAFAAPPPGSPAAPGSAFDQAVSSFHGGRFDEAFQAFDALAGSDANADLWAARSLRQGRGCPAALDRYDRVAQRAAGSGPGWDALLEGARCYASVGRTTQASARLNQLLSVDGYHDRAQAELDRLAGAPKPPAASAPADSDR
ncbi:MAG TPA: zf-HC2 domain-containing protein [Polyangiaceae bacterium]|nr:zf-HC2 domain-containing protein [Polyangiaceae bacterium]